MLEGMERILEGFEAGNLSRRQTLHRLAMVVCGPASRPPARRIVSISATPTA